MNTGSIRFALTAWALLVVAACQQGAPPPQSPVQSDMYRHFALARDMRTFAVSGELDLLRSAAQDLADAEETWGLPPGSAGFVAAVQEEARQAAAAGSIQEASATTAQLAASCGACHLANDVDLGARFQTSEPLADGTTSRHMNHLSWASRLLWNGLVGPSDRTWEIGAGALASHNGFPAPMAQHVPPAELERAQSRLMELGARAEATTEPRQRVSVIADIWTVCADCHMQAGVR